MSFDLNIENYNKRDLENLLSLDNPYKREDVISKCNILKSNLQQTNDNIINSPGHVTPKIHKHCKNFLSDPNCRQK